MMIPEIIVQVTQDSTRVILTQVEGDGVYTWKGVKGYLISSITLQTPQHATDKFIELCHENVVELLHLNVDMWATPPAKRSKPSNKLARFIGNLATKAGIKDS